MRVRFKKSWDNLKAIMQVGFKEEQKHFLIEDCVHLRALSDREVKRWAEPEERSDKLQRGARMPGQRRSWPASIWIKYLVFVSWWFIVFAFLIHWMMQAFGNPDSKSVNRPELAFGAPGAIFSSGEYE